MADFASFWAAEQAAGLLWRWACRLKQRAGPCAGLVVESGGRARRMEQSSGGYMGRTEAAGAGLAGAGPMELLLGLEQA